MDETTDPEAVQALKDVISLNAEGAIEAHDVRTRRAARVTFVEFHLVVPARMAVEDAHAISDRIEQAICDQVGEAVITIHLEPERKAKHRGIVVMS
jgi:divalent metal cation (Fe/Co/Zn/Cd) transporter